MSIEVKHVIAELNKLAPEHLAEEWDNVGLQIGSRDHQVSRILLALDATSKVIDEAISINADMIITHHPMILSPLKNIVRDNPKGNNIYKLIQNNISLYVMHTNFDTACGGTNDILAQKIGLYNIEVIDPDENGMGIGRIGETKKTTIKELSQQLKKELDITHARVVGNLDRHINKVAICTGSGMSFIKSAIGKADIFITGDVKFHEAQEAQELGIGIIDVGHYGSENIAMPSIKRHLDELSRSNSIEIIISQINEDPFIII
ncbi:MAG TPA: Nif3-like dinuclear metal center hexameric protein [Epulopiscium sp.]|nr:Nif3-like dinuclear metal center hexameric protein [Candidatus Epulonipiscium sp.]